MLVFYVITISSLPYDNVRYLSKRQFEKMRRYHFSHLCIFFHLQFVKNVSINDIAHLQNISDLRFFLFSLFFSRIIILSCDRAKEIQEGRMFFSLILNKDIYLKIFVLKICNSHVGSLSVNSRELDSFYSLRRIH